MEDQKQLCNESDSDNRELIKAMRFSQLDDEAAAKLYEERFRQIESDMMKKMQNKKNYQKKGLGNPRSSSSLGTYGTPQHQAILQQGQSPSATFQNTQLFSAKNQTVRSQVLSKFQATAPQQGYMYQSTTLSGASRLPTEENNSQEAQQGFVNFVPQKGKIKSQRSCEFLVTNQSPVHNRQIEENNGGLFLNQGFMSPQQAKSQGQKSKIENAQNNSVVAVLSNQINSYQKQNKPATSQTQYTQQSQISSSQPQRPFLSPPSKRTHQTNLKIGSTANTSQPGISRFEMSPSGRPSTHMTSQGFYSPQASYHHHHSAHIKFNQGTQTTTNRRNQNEGEVKKFMDRKKADNNNFTSSNFATSKYNNGSQTTTASATIVPSSEQLNTNNLLFSNITSNNGAINSPNSYLIQSQNLRSSVGFQGNNSSQIQQNNFGQYQVQAKLNGSNQAKKKESNTNTANNNKRSELEELDLRILTIEREIERDNELTQAYNKKQTTQTSPPSIFKNNQKIQNKQSQTPQAQQISDLHVQQMVNQGLVAPATATHKGSTNLYQNKYFNQNQDNQNQRYSSQNQTYEVAIESSPINLKINNASTKNQNKTQQDFNKLNIPKSDHIMNSHENSSYNNTPRSVNPIHDFRPLNKYQKKQVNFKSDNRMATSESLEDKMFKLSPTSNIFQKSLLGPSQIQELNGNNNNNNANQNEFNLKSQINNQIQMQINSSSNRKNSQIHSNPPSQTRIQTPSHTVVQYSINNQKNQNNLKFQKKLNQTVQQNQYSEHSNSNVQFQNSRLGTEEGDPEMSEFEYLEKIVNAKNTEASSVTDDTSIRNEVQFQAQRVSSQANVKKNVTQQSQKQQSAIILKGKDNNKTSPIKNQYGQRNMAYSNRESTSIQQNQQSSHFIYVEQSPNTIPLNSQKQVKGQTYLSLRQSDIIPSNSSNNKSSTSKSQQKSDSSHITSFQGNSTTQNKKLSLKTLENNFININKDNTDQQSKYSNNSNNAQNSSSVSQSLSPSPVPMYNLYSQQNQVASSSTHKSNNNKHQSFEKQMQKKMNRSSEVLSKNSLNQNSNSNNGNLNTNITRTPSVSSNNISTISNNTSPLIQVSGSATSLNKGQLQMSNKQKNSPPVMMTHTLDTFKNKKDFKIKNPEQVSKIINLDQGQPQVRVEAPKKSNFKQAHFEDDKEEYQLEQMSKNLHKKLNLLLETANQCNENIKSYRISHNV
ncbi:hypothetical protein TTHERM_00013730 (macronuclear) [Tetrahymena thermophila SB210]|uniref:Uncharacterized protein n=1 Tax=Tetrahymena thermophila (strain SB210) TaxID=312017 RepID=Q22RL5_TETTS|nr:hypothetical protein TTHERM_00013730 [Tetrahymena thermophila SB210]EAR88107.2 hypothetical protein TTHERM_00013730 [Tetrahymena thermophila SB210]|eukprot:XP_001008352.2 hypothetical protein TTHERM_00013730 [Tetrahymena thermophila SB210]